MSELETPAESATGAPTTIPGVRRYRRNSRVPFDGITWTGENLKEVQRFVGSDTHGPRFLDYESFTGEEIRGLPVTGLVWDKLHDTWIKVATGDTIMRGVKGEFYPVEPGTLAATYEPWTGLTPEELKDLLPEPFLTIKPGDTAILFLDDTHWAREDGSIALQSALETWARGVNWCFVGNSGFYGVLHVPAEPDDDAVTKPL